MGSLVSLCGFLCDRKKPQQFSEILCVVHCNAVKPHHSFHFALHVIDTPQSVCPVGVVQVER